MERPLPWLELRPPTADLGRIGCASSTLGGGRFPYDVELAGLERQLLAREAIEGAGQCTHVNGWPNRSCGLGVEK